MAILTEFNDAKLMEIAKTFCANSHRIKQHAWWCITRSELQGDGERLHAYADAFGGHLDLTLWNDGAVLFCMAKGYADGEWDWELRFHGDYSRLSPDQILSQFINSLSCKRADLMRIWQNVSPFVERGKTRSGTSNITNRCTRSRGPRGF